MTKMERPQKIDEKEDGLFKRYQQLIKELNLDKQTSDEAWNSFQEIRTNYTLEGNEMHWLGCAIFVACRLSITATLSSNVVKGNPVSLTSLLRSCNLSLTHFFNKIDNWVEMANLQEDFRQKIKKLEENFAITCNIYKEFCPKFSQIFKSPEVDSVRQRNRKNKAPFCTSLKVFEFTWLLFLTIKGKQSQNQRAGNELVTSLHMLLACCDLVFRNAVISDKKELVHPIFETVFDKKQSGAVFDAKIDVPCMVRRLSDDYILTDAIYFKQYTFSRYMKKLFAEGIIQGDENEFTGLLDGDNFSANYTSLSKWYEQHILDEGDFDERIFLAEYQRQLLLKSASNSSNGSTNYLDVPETPKSSSNGETCPDTPLTGRKYLSPKEQNELTPVTSVTQSIARIQMLLNGCVTEPSENLKNIFGSCENDPTELIASILETSGRKFIEAFNEKDVSQQDENKLQLSIKLFYKLLENILKYERTINKNIAPLLEKRVFFECLFACSVEIILHTYKSSRKFPWILNVLELTPSYFMRVIEPIVRLRDQLPRETVKHLNFVEETILESLMWSSESQLWEELERRSDEIPKFEDIALPGTVLGSGVGPGANTTRRALFSPNSQSPGPSAVDTFQSPVKIVKPGQSLLQNNRVTHLVVTDSNGNKKLIPLSNPGEITPVMQSLAETKPKKVGSIYIIFRKFYYLAGVRMEDLCDKLGLKEEVDLKRKIWTVFEYSIRNHIELMKDRHLDQLLMCSVYVICKLTGNIEKNFTQIMKCYRTQPQSSNNVYRNVLIKGATDTDPEHRSNLIEFYNNVYVTSMKNYVFKFDTNTDSNKIKGDLILSPLPSVKSLQVSPRQVTKNVFIKPHESPSQMGTNNGSSFCYCFGKSASKDLKDINKAINGGNNLKRSLPEEFEQKAPIKHFAQRKMQALIEERKVQSK